MTSAAVLKRPSKGRDVTGKTFGYVTAIRFTGKLDKHKSRIWLCKCICGNEREIALRYLRSPKVSCGCMKGRQPGENTKAIHLNNQWIKRPLLWSAQL